MLRRMAAVIGGTLILSIGRAVVSLGTRYNPFDLNFLSKPRINHCHDLLAIAVWRSRLRVALPIRSLGVAMELGRATMPKDLRRSLLFRLVSVTITGLGVTLTSRFAATWSADCSEGFTNWRTASKFAFRDLSSLDLIQLWLLNTGALVLEGDATHYLYDYCRAKSFHGSVSSAVSLLPSLVSVVLRHRAERLKVFVRLFSASSSGHPELVRPTLADLRYWEWANAFCSCVFQILVS